VCAVSSRARRSHGRAWLVPLIMLVVLGLIVAGTYTALTRYGNAMRSGLCTASGLETTHSYSTERTANAAVITAVAVDRGMAPRAASIALATAYQESKLENIDHGDRDSLGLFQQRPSQGWGTTKQVMDPVHAANAFYDRLEKLDFGSMELNDAAQEVQQSGYPEAYADHETEGRLFASALTGQSGANLVCDLKMPTSAASPQSVADALTTQFPRHTKAGTITSALAPASKLTADPVDGAGPTALVIDPHGQKDLGWALANWSVAQAGERGVIGVGYQDRMWDRRAEDQEPGTWRTIETPNKAQGKVVVLVAGDPDA
jgi:hypothetical protein